MSFLTDFHDRRADLNCVNKSYIFLIPKKNGACSPADFMPISLQNCSNKLASKALTTRLQPLIPFLIHVDQSGFIKGRSISGNFVYAADIIQSCHKRKAPAIVLKLDFLKAFDTVNWGALDAVLAAKGFPHLWRSWIQNLAVSSQSAVLLNGVPSPWINCKRGLRQGDPLSPCLFIIVADVLQQLLLRASNNGELSHPLSSSLPCPTLQYADDTLIILKGDLSQLTRLKEILSSSSSFTGLQINFEKSTFIPMNISSEIAGSMAALLGCPISTFPQPYLGLLLTPTKLRTSDLQPLLARFDRYFAGWHGSILNQSGREVLVRSVFSSFPIYAMCSILLPEGTIELLDAKRRAFLWTGSTSCAWANCKAPWELVCLPKEKGGLAIPNLLTQNRCLLHKFLVKLLGAGSAPW
jgi:hypothetical protein